MMTPLKQIFFSQNGEVKNRKKLWLRNIRTDPNGVGVSASFNTYIVLKQSLLCIETDIAIFWQLSSAEV